MPDQKRPDIRCATASSGTALFQPHEKLSTPTGKATIRAQKGQSIPRQRFGTPPQRSMPPVKSRYPNPLNIAANLKSP